MAQASSLTTSLATSLALIDQFITSLDPSDSRQTQTQPASHPSPFHLLIASATSLKSTVTKLSLLTITAPFTPSAVASTLQPLNSSILPSLVTAVLLASPTIYPESFVNECLALTRAALRDLKVLLSSTKVRSEDGQPKKELSDIEKRNVTEATGKVWEDCDLLVSFSKGGVVDFVRKKAGQWLALMQDAVKEFEDWDPEEEVGDDPFGLGDAQSDEEDDTDKTNSNAQRAAMSEGVKAQALRVLRRVPQSIHVVVKQRLEKMPGENLSDPNAPMTPIPPKRRKIIDKLIKKTRKISECIDESAEAMYMGDPELCLKKAGEARALTIQVVEAVLEPWEASDKETKEDQYIKRALVWIQQVDPENQHDGSNGNSKGKEQA